MRFDALVTGAALVLAGILYPAAKWLRPQDAMRGRAAELAVALTGWVVSNFHLRTFDRLYLRWGRLDRLMNLK